MAVFGKTELLKIVETNPLDISTLNTEQEKRLAGQVQTYRGMFKEAHKAQKNLRVILWNTIKSFDPEFSADTPLEELTSAEIHDIIVEGLENRSQKFDEIKREKALKYTRQILEPFIELEKQHWPKGLEQLLNILL